MQGVQEELEGFQESLNLVSPLIHGAAAVEQEDLGSLIKQVNLEQIEKAIPIAKAAEKKLVTQLSQMRLKKEEALTTPEFRQLTDQIKTEKTQIKLLKREHEGLVK